LPPLKYFFRERTIGRGVLRGGLDFCPFLASQPLKIAKKLAGQLGIKLPTSTARSICSRVFVDEFELWIRDGPSHYTFTKGPSQPQAEAMAGSSWWPCRSYVSVHARLAPRTLAHANTNINVEKFPSSTGHLTNYLGWPHGPHQLFESVS
jgi:hypothetical protein